MKRFGAVLATIVLVLVLSSCLQGVEPHASYDRTSYALSLSSNGVVSDKDWVVNVEKDPGKDFVILNLTDIQLGTSAYLVEFPRIRTMISALVEKVRPDLITMTGDMSYGCGTAIYGMCSFIDSFGIPWAPIYGNHDFENSGMSPVTLAKVLGNYSNCIFKDGPKNLAVDPDYGVEAFGNYVVNIVERKNDGFQVVKSLVFFNSGTNGITDLQMDWYQDCVDSVQRYGKGGVVSSVAFMHIPIYEYRTAALNAYRHWSADLATTYTADAWEPGYEGSFGTWHEGIGYRDGHEGFAEVFKSGGTDLLVCGHNHTNCFCIEYDGLTYLYALKTGPGCYYEEGMEGGTEIRISSEGAFSVQHCFYYDGHGCYYTPQSF
ncbi:MAG: metallophosphoesterase [Spirochaetales bacterium]|nr:metallophosphoesterase [Spirochaetales bacterium]